MGLRDIIASGMKTIDSVTKDLQVKVLHESVSSQTSEGSDLAPTSTYRMALVDKTQRMVKLNDGRQVVASAQVTFPRPTAVSTRDFITLPDGYRGPVLNTGGFIDRKTGAGFLADVWVG